ncbi:hypothetical protein Lser_V15G07283 [Lactuca serriola]
MQPKHIPLIQVYEPLVADIGHFILLTEQEAYNEEELVNRMLGYLEPEYFNAEPITEKVDIYAFGLALLELITCIRIREPQGYKAHEFWHDICASQEMELVYILADKDKLLKSEMKFFSEQILLSELKLSASDWRIPIIFLVSCSIIACWEQFDWWLSWWKGRLAEDATGEEAWAIQIQFLETSLEDKNFWKAGVMI